MSAPLVTVVIPVFNGADYLGEAIDSAIAQTYSNVEIIVIDDGSTDDGATEKVAKGRGDRLRYIRKENGGVASALNHGIQKASGEYIAWLSHDDAFKETKLEKQVDLIQSLPSKNTILYSDVEIMDENSKTYSEVRNPEVDPRGFYQALLGSMVVRGLFDHPPFGVNGCTTLIPKRAFDTAGEFDTRLRTTQDYDMWFRLNRTHDFVGMQEPLLRSRVHKGQGTHKWRNEMAVEVDDLYWNALAYYKEGGERFRLNLPRLAYALRFDPRRKKAYDSVMALARCNVSDRGDLGFLTAARLLIPTVANLCSLVRNGRMMIKRKMA
ncbi:MAG: glycosyltransferase [Methanomassiliicoccales archaeon]|jgi:glycosyltransferase involved in cell wall biosynthesis